MTPANLERVLKNPRIPTLPAVAVRLLELTRSHKTNLRELAEVIETDQALAVKIVRTVNSSYYGLTRPCGTVNQAIVYLGLNAVKTLVLGFSLVQSIDGGGEDEVAFDYVDYWRRAIYSAVAARELARLSGCVDPDEAFLAALVQDLGMVAMNRTFGDTYLQAIDLAGGSHEDLPAIERRALEVDHCQVGAEIAEHWRLPASLVEAIRWHHQADHAPEHHRDLVRMVELAGLAAAIAGPTKPDAAVSRFKNRAAEWFDLDEAQARAMLEAMAASAADISSVFHVDLGDPIRIDDILAQADELQTRQFIGLAMQSRSLRQRLRLQAGAEQLDPLTSLHNRRHFEQALAAAFDHARTGARPLGLILCQVHRVRQINEQHGVDGGDAALQQTAQLIGEIVAPEAAVGRYAGTTFAILLPGLDRLESGRCAGNLCRAIAANPLRLTGASAAANACAAAERDDCSPRVLASLGVAAYEPEHGGALPGPAVLMRLAEQALAAAKAEGRNCVRVYHPDQRGCHAA